jgi:hypothetical protein
MGAVLAVTGISVFQLSNTLKENNIQLIDAEGNAFAQPGVEDLNGPINLLLVGSDTRLVKEQALATKSQSLPM